MLLTDRRSKLLHYLPRSRSMTGWAKPWRVSRDAMTGHRALLSSRQLASEAAGRMGGPSAAGSQPQPCLKPGYASLIAAGVKTAEGRPGGGWLKTLPQPNDYINFQARVRPRAVARSAQSRARP